MTAGAAPSPVSEAGDGVAPSAVEESRGVVGSAAIVRSAGVVGSADAAPTQQSQQVFAGLSSHQARQQGRLHEAETALGELDAMLRSLNIR